VTHSRLLVIADAHVGGAPAESDAALLAFLDEAPSMGDALLIVGDLFEFWYGYARAIPRRGFSVAAALSRLTRLMPVSMVGGNHDRWGKPFWLEDAGVAWSPDELVLEAGHRRILVRHGDGLTERPGRSAWTHRIVGHPLTSAVFGLLHPDLGLRLVDRLSFLLSRPQSPEERQRYAEQQRQWAEARLAADPSVDAVVMGHSHAAALTEPFPGRFYLNPGAWLADGCYAVITPDGAELRQFNPAAPPPHLTAAPR